MTTDKLKTILEKLYSDLKTLNIKVYNNRTIDDKPISYVEPYIEFFINNTSFLLSHQNKYRSSTLQLVFYSDYVGQNESFTQIDNILSILNNYGDVGIVDFFNKMENDIEISAVQIECVIFYQNEIA